MNIAETLDELKRKAGKDAELKRRILQTRTEANPLSAFCNLCRKLGYPVYEMDLACAGESFYAEIKRSTNGGGENSPLLKGEDDFYEMFFEDALTASKELEITLTGKSCGLEEIGRAHV